MVLDQESRRFAGTLGATDFCGFEKVIQFVNTLLYIYIQDLPEPRDELFKDKDK